MAPDWVALIPGYGWILDQPPRRGPPGEPIRRKSNLDEIRRFAADLLVGAPGRPAAISQTAAEQPCARPPPSSAIASVIRMRRRLVAERKLAACILATIGPYPGADACHR